MEDNPSAREFDAAWAAAEAGTLPGDPISVAELNEAIERYPDGIPITGEGLMVGIARMRAVAAAEERGE